MAARNIRKQYDRDLALEALRNAGIPATSANLKKLIKKAPELDGNRAYANTLELTAGAAKLAAELAGGSMRATRPIGQIVAAPPKEVARYDLKLSEDRTTLTFDPSRELRPHALRAGATRGVEVGRTERGGARIRITGADEQPMELRKGKWVTTTLAQVVKSAKDLASLEAAGYNLNALRKVMVVETEDGESTYFAMRQQNVDKDDPRVEDRYGHMPGFGGREDPTRGLVAICSEVTIVGFDVNGPIFTVRKPVIYLYPERRMDVRVEVRPVGEFIAQYPEVENGTWSMVAMPDGQLFDPKTEKRYGYLFWEGTNPGNLEIDRDRAYCVRSHEVEPFLEKMCTKFGLNDREKTDFISYWIAPLKRNPVSLIQFLTGNECDAYATMTIDPAPNSEIRMFMMFQRIPDVIDVGSPEVETLKRHRFTVVEWGGANLDE